VSYSRIDFPRNNPFASIWGGSTLPDYRGRGLYSALIAARLQEAEKRGYQYLTVDANPETSMPILQKLGFVTIGYATAFNLEV
jgi:GNAT superfamily N-acetyltransferase